MNPRILKTSSMSLLEQQTSSEMSPDHLEPGSGGSENPLPEKFFVRIRLTPVHAPQGHRNLTPPTPPQPAGAAPPPQAPQVPQGLQ